MQSVCDWCQACLDSSPLHKVCLTYSCDLSVLTVSQWFLGPAIWTRQTLLLEDTWIFKLMIPLHGVMMSLWLSSLWLLQHDECAAHQKQNLIEILALSVSALLHNLDDDLVDVESMFWANCSMLGVDRLTSWTWRQFLHWSLWSILEAVYSHAFQDSWDLNFSCIIVNICMDLYNITLFQEIIDIAQQSIKFAAQMSGG